MTDHPAQTPEATEAEDVGERPDLGRIPDALREALTGSGVGSDTRAGSLQGGAATGSDDDPDQAAVDRAMKAQGHALAAPPPPAASGEAINNTGVGPGENTDADPAGVRDTDAGAPTG